MKKNIAVYMRVSSAGQDTAAQEPELAAWVKTHAKGRDVSWYQEQFTGRSFDRPMWRKLEERIRAGQVDTLVIWRLDRLGRTAGEMITFLDQLRTAGVRFVSLKDAVDTSTPTGRLLRTILAGFAEYEREVISERIRAGISKARAQGKNWGGRKKGTATALTTKRMKSIETLLKAGTPKSEIARQLHIARSTLYQAVDMLTGVHKTRRRRPRRD